VRAPLTTLILACGACAQTPYIEAARAWRQSHESAILGELASLIRLPNVASNLGDIRRNAEAIIAMYARRGVTLRELAVPGAPPSLYGELTVPGARRTLIFYAHYDGQPVEPQKWLNGDPWRPVLRAGARTEFALEQPHYNPEWRLYGRSASDDKAPVVAFLAVLDALAARGLKPRSNIKFFLEGEEEAGSPNLEAIVERHKPLLAGDAWLICDGPVHQNRQQQIYFGARGVTGLELTVYGALRELHSGHYGNWAPNPAMMLARLLATITDGEGRVLIDGFYDGIQPLTELERKALAEAPDFDEELKRELGLAAADGSGRKLHELINLPSFNVRGLESVGVGAQARNVVPASATASIDIRLVKGLDHARQVERVIAHLRKQGYHVTADEPTAEERRRHAKIARVVKRGGYNAVRTPMDLPVAQDVLAAAARARGPVVRMPTLGGSVPIYVFERLGAPVIGVPIANHDNNQHSSNENIRLRNLWDGIELYAELMAIE